MPNPLALPTPPSAARVFFGYRAERLREQPSDDEAAKSKKRSDFFAELGGTFMPGTPLMQAPLGLAAYLPAVIDPDSGSDHPDEVALIIYVSKEVYQSTRKTSLSRRMYTRAHYAVFDMAAAVADFPDPIATPKTVETHSGPFDLWFLFDHASDWQDGEARVLLIEAPSGGADFRSTMRARALEAAEALRSAGCDQVIAAVSDRLACLWVHAETDAGIDLAALIGDTNVVRDLPYQPAFVRGDEEAGEVIDGASAYNWRFSRELRYF